MPVPQSPKYWRPEFSLQGENCPQLLYFFCCYLQIVGLKKNNDHDLPYKINGELRHEKILVVGIWGSMDVVFSFSSKNAWLKELPIRDSFTWNL